MTEGAAGRYTLWAIIGVIGGMLSFQFGAGIAKSLFSSVGPLGATALRQTLAAIFLMVLFRPWRNWPPRSAWKWLILFGLNLGLMNLCFYLSFQRIPLGIAVAIEFMGPLSVAVWSSRRALDFVWVACAATGLWFLLPHAGGGALDPIGVALAVAAGVGWASYILLGQKVTQRVPEGQAVSFGVAFSCLVTLPLALITIGAPLFQPQILLTGLMVALLSSAVPYTLEMFALKRIPARTFSILMSLEPALAALSGLILLHEALSPQQWLAIALVVLASGGSALTARRAQMAPQ
jgi:inner membrane transporter RhtA